ncbi:MAG: glycosyltransferase family 39 protein [Nanoarchaeota archaeon]|nr:glycosyltransferase family 39 protein [Nanoarchaeota archaeon]
MSKIKENWEIFVLVLFFLGIKLFFLLKPHLVSWDEAVYLAIGKFIWSWGQVGIWEKIRPLGLPILLGIFWKLKLNYFLWAEALVNLFAAGNLILVYFIGKKLYHKYLGLMAALFLGVMPIFFSQSSLILTSIPSTFFALLAVYFYLLRRSFVLIGLFSALSFLFRFPQGLLLICFLLLIWLKEKNKINQTIKLISGFLILFVPFIVANYFLYITEVSNIFHALFRPLILGVMHQANPFNAQYSFFYFEKLFQQNYFLVFSLLGLVFFIKDFKKNKKWLVVWVIGLIYLGYFTYIINKQLRFSLAFLPYFCLVAAFGFYEFYNLIKERKIVQPVFSFVLVLFVIFSVVGMVRENDRDYLWRLDYEHPIVDIYRYPNFEGRILTGNPIPAAYLERLFVSFYQDPPTAREVYDLEKSKIDYVIYFEQFYPCWNEECVKLKGELFDLIEEENELIYSTSLNGQDFYFFESI